jgi:hypothetical protein
MTRRIAVDSAAGVSEHVSLVQRHMKRNRMSRPSSIPLKYHLGAIFVHIPKTAGTTVHAVLDDAWLPASGMQARRQAVQAVSGKASALDRAIYPKHGKAAELRRLVGIEVWELAFKFTIVRNPWAVMVSSYFWWLQWAGQYPLLAQKAAAVRELGGFRGFVLSETGGSMINELPGTMSDWFSENGRDLVDFIGKVETFSLDIRAILQSLGAEYRQAIPHLNRSAHGSYHDYYDKETRLRVAKRFADVIERFEYRF